MLSIGVQFPRMPSPSGEAADVGWDVGMCTYHFPIQGPTERRDAAVPPSALLCDQRMLAPETSAYVKHLSSALTLLMALICFK